jgi:GNAT superfamily N-acetyltransferase
MGENYQIVLVDKQEESAWRIIGQGLRDHNKQQAGDDKSQGICLALYSPNEEMVGGVIAEVYWDWLFINVLWVKDVLRGQGYGKSLLMRVEEEARQRGAKNSYLDTFSFQAPGFYKRNGYQVFGELLNFPPGHQRYFFTKSL